MDPFAFLTDWITEPSADSLPMARRMAIRLMMGHEDLDTVASLQDRLCAALEAILEAWDGSVHRLFDAQQAARVILLDCRGRVLH